MQIAAKYASLGVVKLVFPQKLANISKCFRIFSVLVSSVLASRSKLKADNSPHQLDSSRVLMQVGSVSPILSSESVLSFGACG